MLCKMVSHRGLLPLPPGRYPSRMEKKPRTRKKMKDPPPYQPTRELHGIMATKARNEDQLTVRGKRAMQVIREVTANILERNLLILEAASHWADMDLGAPEPPQEWIDTVGEERAKKTWRVARCAQMPSKDAPIGLKMASTTVLGILTTYERNSNYNRELAAGVVDMPTESFPEQEVDD